MITRYVFETESDWLEYRENIFTASEVNRLTAEPTKKEIAAGETLSKGAKTYIFEKISALFGSPKPVFYNMEMQWGKDTEPEAALTLCEILGLDPASDEVIYTSHNGTVFFSDGLVGGTPDLILPKQKAICEIKCPNSATHLYNCINVNSETLADEYPNYYDQMQTNMYLCESEFGYFFSFDPRIKNGGPTYHIVRIERNEERINLIKSKVTAANALKNKYLCDLKE